MSIEFLLTSLVVILLPGTGVIYTLAIGLGRGFSASVAAAVGCTLGIVPAALASIIGLSALLHAGSAAFQIIKVLGVIYLLYMAWNILKEHGTLDVSESRVVESYSQVALNGTLLNVLNPKLSLFFLAFLPQFLSQEEQNSTLALSSLAGVFMLMTFLVFVAYGAFATFARDYVMSRPSAMMWIRRLFAGTFGFLGLKLAISES